MSIENEIEFVDEVARYNAKMAVREAERIVKISYLVNRPRKRPLRNALLILSGLTLLLSTAPTLAKSSELTTHPSISSTPISSNLPFPEPLKHYSK